MKKVVTTSWDDGHKLDLKLAHLLQKYNVPATFYISPANREFSKKDLLSEQEIQSLSQNFEIGGHTLHHPNLAQVSLDYAIDNIKAGKETLESIVGKEIKTFAYTYGAYTERIRKVMHDLGFVVARTTKRFSTMASSEKSTLSTTVHAYTHLSDMLQLPKYRTRKWQKLARYFFDQVMEAGGIFHLWGHSWEIDKNDEWGNLEEILQYISNHRNIEY